MGGKAVVQLTDQRTQRALRHRDAQTDERKEGLGEDGGGDAEHNLRDDGSDDVGQHFLENDEEAARAQRAGRQNKFLILQFEHLGAGDAAHAHPLGQHQSEDDGHHAGLQHQQQQCDDDQPGDAVGHFQKALHHHIDLAAEVAGDQAIAHADDHIDDGGGHGDDEGNASALPRTGPDVAAVEVAAEPVVDVQFLLFLISVGHLGAGGGAHLLAAVQNAELLNAGHTGRKVLLAQVLARVGVAVHAGAEDGQQHDEDDEHEAQHRALFLEEADERILPEALGCKVGIHRDLGLVVLELEIGGGEGFIRGGRLAHADRFCCHLVVPLCQTNARIDDAVQQVNDQHDANVHSAVDEAQADDHIVVVGLDSRHQQAAHTGDGEDLLHHQRAGHQIHDQRCQHRDDGDEGVAQGVAEDQRRAGDALALGQQHIIGVEDFDHLAAGEAGDGRHGEHGQRHAGQYAGPEDVLRGEEHRKPAELEAEGVAQRQRKDVGRHRHADDRDDGGDGVKDGVPLEGGNDAQHKAHHGTQHDRHAADLDGDGQTGLDELGDGRILGDIVADAEIAAKHIAHIAEELDVDGLVEAVLCVQGRAHVSRQLFIVEGRTGHQLHQDEQDQQNGQQSEQRGQDSLERIFFHVGWTPFVRVYFRGQPFVCRGQVQCQKGAQWLLRATVRPYSAIQLFTRSWWCSCTHGSERRGDARHP